MDIRHRNVLLQRPIFMEDEGNFHPCYVFENFDDLSRWMEENDYVDGYFKSEDFVYAGTGGPGENRHKVKRLGS